MDNGTATAQLEKLAELLQRREWKAALGGSRSRPSLRVANPRIPTLSETVHCDGAFFLWSWRERIGAVDDKAAVADRITHVLRGVESCP